MVRSNVMMVVMAALVIIGANAVADVTVDDGSTLDVDYTITGNLFIGNTLEGGTVNLLPGGHVTNSVYVGSGGVLNVLGGTVAWEIYNIGGVVNYEQPTENIAPVADGGGPYNIETTDPAGASVLLSALASTDEDGTVASHHWDLDGDGLYDELAVAIMFDAPVGVSEVTLMVIDNEGLESEPVNVTITVTFVEPEIDVDVEGLAYDYGDLAIGESKTFVVPIYNQGDSDLTVTSVTIAGSGDFAITASPAEPIVIAPSETIGVDVEVTYTPTLEGLVSATVTIESNDADESVIEVVLTGCGVVVVVPPEEQIQNTLDFYDQAVADITIIGYGPGKSADKRLKALRNMIKAAGDLINLGEYELAAQQLTSVAKKTDGEVRPPDFVVGYAVEELNTMVNDLIEDLGL